MYTHIHVLMRRKEEISKRGQTNKVKHSTPKAVTFPELPQVELYMYMCVSVLYTVKCDLMELTGH